MSKNKKKGISKPKREPAKVPVDYLLSVADRIHKINPTRKILFNTLVDVYCTAHGSGYQRRIEDDKYFKTKQEKHIQDEFKSIMDNIDDEIHCKTNN
jgi:hypothetical protein